MSGFEETPALLRLPYEIRLLIYEELLVAKTQHITRKSNLVSIPDYHEYDATPDDTEDSGYTIDIRSFPETLYSAAVASGRFAHRSPYKVRGGRFRNECLDTAYVCGTQHDIDVSILGVNRQLHDEAARVLYSSYTFDFDTSVEACTPFLTDLTPVSRACIRRIGIVKRALPYDKDFDRCEWHNMCSYLATQLALRQLSLGIVAGKPLVLNGVAAYEAGEFKTLMRSAEMSWVEDLAQIKGLQHVNVRACVEHCPPPESEMMRFFVAFSASVDNTFTEYLCARMMTQAA